MLVLTRYKGQKIVIGNQEIIISIINISDRVVKLGFEAPENIIIHREEVFERIKEGVKRKIKNTNNNQ